MTRAKAPPSGYGNPPESKRYRKGNVPHNKRASPPDTLKKAAARSLSSTRIVVVGDELKKMSCREIVVHDDVQKALKGNVSAIIRIVTFMMEYPELIEGKTEWRIVISGAAARL